MGSAGVVGDPAPGLVIGSAGDAAGGGAVSAGGAVSSSFEHAASRLTDAAMAMTARYVRVFFMGFLTLSRVAVNKSEPDATDFCSELVTTGLVTSLATPWGNHLKLV